MAADLVTISSSVLPETARVVGFRGTEALSRPYQIEIFLTVAQQAGEEIDLNDAIGAKACLTIDRAADRIPPFHFAGILATVEILHAAEGRLLLRVVLVPRLWQLSLSKHSRIFTNQSIPDIIKSVLDENGVTDVEIRLGSYESEEHVCQYRESDLDFISRWMEREGIFYFFEHDSSGEKLILCDATTYDDDPIGSPVRYFPQVGQDTTAGPSLRSFTCRHNILAAKVQLRDYDYIKPNLKVEGSAEVASNGAGEISLYGERFFTPAAGENLAKIRSEELRARQVVYHAIGTRLHLRPGYVFELEDHPVGSFNAKYLAMEVRHYGNQATGLTHFRELIQLDRDDVYTVELDAIPAKKQFRAECRTAWPRIYGFENGIVDGAAASEYAQIDDHGRYNVKFKFDESALRNGKASTFVRMMQPHGGGIEGFHFPLRKGTEVVLSFLGGDPDRPVISGVVPNVLTPSPVTRGNHTKNVIQTGGRNRLELEDKSGQQRVTLSTPYSNTYLRMGSSNDEHELIVKTDDNTLLDAGKNFDQTVGQNGGGSWDAKIKDNWVTHVQSGDHELWVDAGRSATTVKGDTLLRVVSGNHYVDVDAGVQETNVKGDTTLSVKSGNYTVNVDAKNTKIDTKAGTTEILSKGNVTIKSESGDITIDAVSGKMTINAKGGIDITSAGDISVKGAQKWYQYTAGDWAKFNSSSGISLTVGMTSDTKIGIANENFIGGKVSSTLGGFAEFNAAYKFAMTAAISMEYKFGASLCINAAAEVTAKATRVNGVAAAIENMPTWMGTSAVRFSLSGAHVLT